MKTRWTLAMLAAMATAGTPALAQPATCLLTKAIQEARGEANGTSVLFKMEGGAQWRSVVQGACPGLANSLISWTTNNIEARGEGGLCETPSPVVWVQSDAPRSCTLGKFERVIFARSTDAPAGGPPP